MKTPIKLLAGIALMGALQAQAGTMTNPGFETGDSTGWTANSAGGTVVVVSNHNSYVSDGGAYTTNPADPRGVPYTDANAAADGYTYFANHTGSSGPATGPAPADPVSPAQFFLKIGGGAADTWQTVSQSISLNQGDTLNVWAAFDWGDYGTPGGSWFDGVYAKLLSGTTVVANLFEDDGGSDPDFYDGPWTFASFVETAATASYVLEFGSQNTSDDINPSFGLFDATITNYVAPPPPPPPPPPGPSGVPEPATLALLGLGLMGLGLSRRRKN